MKKQTVRDEKEFRDLLAEIDKKREYYRNHPEEARNNIMQKWENDQESISNPKESAKKLKMIPADKASSNYDSSKDILCITFDDLYDPNTEVIKIPLKRNIDLFFDKQFKFPIRLRISNATKKFEVRRSSLRKYFNFNMLVDGDVIKAKLFFKFDVHGKLQKEKEFISVTDNEEEIPHISLDIANSQNKTNHQAHA